MGLYNDYISFRISKEDKELFAKQIGIKPAVALRNYVQALNTLSKEDCSIVMNFIKSLLTGKPQAPKDENDSSVKLHSG